MARLFPGSILRDLFTDPLPVKWRIEAGFATSDELPDVRLLGAPFMGNIGVAPSMDLLRMTTDREADLLASGG